MYRQMYELPICECAQAKKYKMKHPGLSQVVELDLTTVVPCCSGPKRPQDRISVSDMKNDFETCLGAKVGTSTLACFLHHASHCEEWFICHRYKR